MTTIHDEEKIKELSNSFCTFFNFAVGSEQEHEHIKDMKQYAEHIRQKTIDECIACIPRETQTYFSCPVDGYRMGNPTFCSHVGEWQGFNECRQRFITNIEQLKK